MSHRIVLVALLAAAALPASARAEGPDRSTAVFQDWILNCATEKVVAAGEKPDAAKTRTTCEVAQTFRNKQNAVIAIVAYGRSEAGAERRFVVQTPTGVWLPDGVALTPDKKPAVTGTFLRCTPTACIGAIDGKKDLVDALKAPSPVVLEFSDATRTKAKISLSPKGFADAIGALDQKDK